MHGGTCLLDLIAAKLVGLLRRIAVMFPRPRTLPLKRSSLQCSTSFGGEAVDALAALLTRQPWFLRRSNLLQFDCVRRTQQMPSCSLGNWAGGCGKIDIGEREGRAEYRWAKRWRR